MEKKYEMELWHRINDADFIREVSNVIILEQRYLEGCDALFGKKFADISEECAASISGSKSKSSSQQVEHIFTSHLQPTVRFQ